MFKKLRNRLLIMNLSIISILMLIAFSTIYIMTYNNIHSSITHDLFRLSDFKNNIGTPPKTDIPFNQKEIPKENTSYKIMPERTISFSIITNREDEIISIDSFFVSDDTFYLTALETVLQSSKESGHFTLDNNEWAYLKTLNKNEIYYAFLDMTAQQKVLDRLIITFIIVSVLSLLAIFAISNFLTNRSIKPIKEAFDKQKQFISDASHELKTPLAVIRTNVDVLLSNQSKDEDIKWLKYIKSEVERMGSLTNDLLYLTQMEGSKTSTPLKRPILLNDKIKSLLLGIEAIAFEKEILLDYEMESNINVFGNSEQLVQVIMILLDNALKYTPRKGHIQLSMHKSHHHVTITVKNTGDGISAKDIPHIFDRFYRVDKSRSRTKGSYGLGLAIAKVIVDQHKGKITCESTPSVDTTFTVKLPLVT